MKKYRIWCDTDSKWEYLISKDMCVLIENENLNISDTCPFWALKI